MTPPPIMIGRGGIGKLFFGGEDFDRFLDIRVCGFVAGGRSGDSHIGLDGVLLQPDATWGDVVAQGELNIKAGGQRRKDRGEHCPRRGLSDQLGTPLLTQHRRDNLTGARGAPVDEHDHFPGKRRLLCGFCLPCWAFPLGDLHGVDALFTCFCFVLRRDLTRDTDTGGCLGRKQKREKMGGVVDESTAVAAQVHDQCLGFLARRLRKKCFDFGLAVATGEAGEHEASDSGGRPGESGLAVGGVGLA